jgi:septum formation protein
MKETFPVVLASASPARKNLLIQAGVTPIVISSDINEAKIFDSLKNKKPVEIVEALARAKAQAVMADHQLPQMGLLIAADSMWEFEGELVGKPKDEIEAKRRISAMSGKTGTLHTGHYLVNLANQQSQSAVISTDVAMDEISESEIEAYLDTEEPLAVAGSFTLNGYGAAFVKSVNGDSNNVIGLSINTVKTLSGRLGLKWSNAWNQLI